MTVEELKEEYEDKINALKEEFNDKIAELQKEKESNERWKPEVGKKYYYISDSGEIGCITYTDDNIDEKCYNFYNMFKTKEETEFERERWKVIRELEILADDDKEWDGCHMHYAIKYDGESLYGTNFLFDMTHSFYFKSEESAQKAIDIIGEDRLKKYWLGIKEK